jgi:two-component system sensor histidine kinase PilS (NtrC family)
VTAADAKRLRVFSAARLGLAGFLLALVPGLPEDLVPGLHGAMAALALLGALASAAMVLFLPPLSVPRRMAWLILLLDTVLVTAFVAATGGPRSLFAFLYVLTVIAACVLLSRSGGLVIAGFASALYAALVFGRTILPATARVDHSPETTALEIFTMFLNTGTFLIVGLVAGGLAERFRQTSHELETKRRDFRDLEAFKDVIFQSVSTGLIALDDEHRVTAFNRAAEGITGVAAREAIGRPGTRVFGPAVPLGTIETVLAGNTRGSARHETTLTRPDGSTVPVRMTFSVLRSGDGARLGLIAACDDLSRIREMEARMRQADRLASLGRMAANIAHEIRNPLASLSGAIEALTTTGDTGPRGGDVREDERGDDERERLSQIVLRESDRLNEIIRGFLEYARPAPLALDAVNLADVLDEVLLLLEHGALPPGVKLARDFPPDLVWRIDPHQFRQALWNLCRNAIETMPDGGELLVGASPHADRVEVWVSDTGRGIPAADLPHIFEPFFSTKPGGSGLGLALVHRIVSEHGGQVDVRSAPGLGTTFTITLPRTDG